MLSVKWMCVWVFFECLCVSCVISVREMVYIAGITVQICQELDCSPNEHTHTHTRTCLHGLPYFVKDKCIQVGGNEIAPLCSCRSSGLSNITAAPTATSVKQQIYIQHHRPVLFSENVISHFAPGFKFEAVHRDNLWIWTPCMYWQRSLPTSLHLSLLPTPCLPQSAPPHLPRLSLILCLLSPHSYLCFSPACQGWFQACCVWPDFVGCDRNSNYNSLWIAFPPSLLPIIRGLNPALQTDMQGPEKQPA